MTATQEMGGRAHGSSLGFALALLWVALPLSALAADELKIRGRVLDEQGNPAAHLSVFAVCTGALPEGPYIDCGFPGLYGRQAKTDEAGRFSLEKMPRAVYSIYAVLEAPGPGRKVAAEAALSLPLREDKDGLELRLKRSASASGEDKPGSNAEGKSPHSISGRVVDASGAPVRSASVTANLENPSKEQSLAREPGGLRGEDYAETDASGHFVLNKLFKGSYKLRVWSPRFFSVQPVVRTGEGPVTLPLKRRGVARGRAVMPDGSPVAGLISGCQNGSKSQLPDGGFEAFSDNELGGLMLCLSAPGMSRVRRGLTVLPEQVLELGELRMEPARLLKVQLTDMSSGQPVGWATVSVGDVQEPSSTYLTVADGGIVIQDFADMELDLNVSAPGFLPMRFHVRKGQTEAKVALDPGVIVTGRALNEKGEPQIGSVSASCAKSGSTQGTLDAEGRFRLQGLTSGLCSVTLTVFSPPIQTFENTRYFWVAGKEPISLEFQYPAVRHSIHLRFQGDGTPHHALLFAGELPQQMELGPLALSASIIARPWMPEVGGYRGGIAEEKGFRFENLGAGRYTLLVLVGDGLFRTPLTVGAAEETLQVVIPPKLIPLPVSAGKVNKSIKP